MPVRVAVAVTVRVVMSVLALLAVHVVVAVRVRMAVVVAVAALRGAHVQVAHLALQLAHIERFRALVSLHDGLQHQEALQILVGHRHETLELLHGVGGRAAVHLGHQLRVGEFVEKRLALLRVPRRHLLHRAAAHLLHARRETGHLGLALLGGHHLLELLHLLGVHLRLLVVVVAVSVVMSVAMAVVVSMSVIVAVVVLTVGSMHVILLLLLVHHLLKHEQVRHVVHDHGNLVIERFLLQLAHHGLLHRQVHAQVELVDLHGHALLSGIRLGGS
mmetsp:Transcript_28/g.48  ORF Transcript_28/g.48 Transcript_28/m.48 type:complete len:274 (-) Transcript_28:878-1699(-)